MQHIAFFRNVNQGQRGHPTTEDLLNAVAAAGGADAFPYRSNGTIVFEAEDAAAVASALQHDRLVFMRPARFLEALLHFEGSPLEEHLEVTFFDPRSPLTPGNSLDSAMSRGRCEIVEQGPGWALVLNHRDRQSNGTPVIERVIGGPASSRGLTTLIGLARRLSDSEPPRLSD